jgi:hypothetical protein
MTVVRLRDQSLWLHSPIALEPEQHRWLESQGEIKWVVAPNAFHCSELAWYLERHPQAFGVASDGALPAVHRQARRNLLHSSQVAKSHWSPDLVQVAVLGTRLMHETAYFHQPSRTLILTDLAFCMDDSQFGSGLERRLMRWNRVGGGQFGPSWLAENFFFKNHGQVAASIQSIAAWDFDRIIVSHGKVIESGGRQIFKSAFKRWLTLAEGSSL